MKRILFTTFGFLLFNLSYGQSINGKAVNNWDECVSLSQTEFKNTCLGDDREKGWLSAHAIITNNCEQRIKVVWEYLGRMKEGKSASKESTSRNFYLKSNESKKVYTCNTIANEGSIQIISVESADSNYTPSIKNENTSSWDENKSLLSDESKNYAKNGVTVPEESIYEKRRKEAEVKVLEKQRREEIENKRIQEFEAREKKRYNDVLRANREADAKVKKYFGTIAEQQKRASQKKSRELDEYFRKQDEEERLKKIQDEKEEIEKRKRREIYKKQNDFLDYFKTTEIPDNYNKTKAFFIVAEIDNDMDDHIILKKVALRTNSDNQLPSIYSVRDKIKKDKYANELFFEGPYASKEKLEIEFEKLVARAKLSHVNVEKGGFFDLNLVKAVSNPNKYNSFKSSDKYGYKDNKGNVLIEAKYESAGRFFNNLAGVRLNGKWGFIDKSDTVVISFKYDYVGEFRGGFASVTLNDKVGLIDKSGSTVIPPKYDRLDFSFLTEVAEVKLNGKYGIIDKNGTIITPIKYDRIGYFSDGLARVLLNKKWGFIDKNGTVVIPPKYEAVGNFSDGLVSVKLNNKYGFIDKRGFIVIPLMYEAAGRFSDGFAKVKLSNKVGLIDKSGVAKYSPNYVSFGDLSEGLAVFRENRKYYGFKDKNGTVVISPKYDYYNNFSNGLAGVKLNDKYGFIDKKGTIIVPLEYDYVRDFSDGLAGIKQNGKWGVVDKNNKIVVSPKYDFVGDFHEGLTRVELNGKWGYINEKGGVVIPLNYDFVEKFSEGLSRVKLKGKWGYINKKGTVVIPLAYEYLGGFSEGYAKAKLNSKYGLIDKKGTIVVPSKYDYLGDFSGGLTRVILNSDDELLSLNEIIAKANEEEEEESVILSTETWDKEEDNMKNKRKIFEEDISQYLLNKKWKLNYMKQGGVILNEGIPLLELEFHSDNTVLSYDGTNGTSLKWEYDKTNKIINIAAGDNINYSITSITSDIIIMEMNVAKGVELYFEPK